MDEWAQVESAREILMRPIPALVFHRFICLADGVRPAEVWLIGARMCRCSVAARAATRSVDPEI